MGHIYNWIIFPALVLAAMLLWHCIPRRRRLGRFADRDNLPADSIYNKFFAQANLPKDLVLQIWCEVATSLGVPAGKLRPSDRFDKELAPVEGWEFDDDALEINWTAGRRLKRLGSRADLSHVETLKDYVELLCRLEMGGHAT